MQNKVLVNLYVPFLEKRYEVFLPASKRIGDIIALLGKNMNEISGGYYNYLGNERLYNRQTGKEYSVNEILKHTNIRNGTELIFM